MTGTETSTFLEPDQLHQFRVRNWWAIGIGTVLMFIATVAYATAFVDDDGRADDVDFTLVGIALVIVPSVFLTLAFVSQNIDAPKRVLQAMGLMLAIALMVGLLEPVLGAALGFAGGAALTLRPPPVPNVAKWRTGAIFVTGGYLVVLLLLVPPGGVFGASLVPLVMIGAADEYAIWSADN